MKYTNNNLSLLNLKEYDLKDFKLESFLGSPNEYYEYVFEIIKLADNIIEELFTRNTWSLTFVFDDILNIDSLNKNYEKKRFKIFSVLFLIFKRLNREHHCLNGLGIIINDDYQCLQITLNLIKEIKYPQFDDYARSNNRLSGRTTRNANDLIQYAYNNWKENNNYPVNIVDHFTYELIQNNLSMRGRRIFGHSQANDALLNKIKNRIQDEFPEDISKFIRINSNLEMYFEFPHIDKINFNAIS